MAIYKRGRIWWIHFYDQNNRRVAESSSSVNRKEAERLLAARLTDVERGKYRAPSKIAFDESAEKYVRYAK